MIPDEFSSNALGTHSEVELLKSYDPVSPLEKMKAEITVTEQEYISVHINVYTYVHVMYVCEEYN